MPDNSARGQLGPRQVGPYVKTTRTVLLFYNIVQYLCVYLFTYLKDNYHLLVKMNYLLNDNIK